MTTHQTFLAGAEELIVYAIRAVRASRGEAFEIGYDAADRAIAWAVTRMLESADVGGRINVLDAHPGDEPPR